MKKPNLKINKKKILLLVIALIVIIAVFMIISNIFKNKKDVNGNISNRGLVTYVDGVTFYNRYEKGIVKYKGNKEYLITDETAYSINVIGDNIYYLTVSDTGSIDIKTVKTNGDGLKKIKTIGTAISKIYVQNGYIYYATNQGIDGIARINIENNEETIITTAVIQDFQVLDDGVYFTDNINNVYKMSLTGIDLNRISDELRMKQFQIVDNWIYFIDLEENNLYKVKLDGTDKTLVSDKIKDNNYNITKNRIYFFDSESKKICSVNLKGNNYKEIVMIQANKTKINIADDTLYYLDTSKDESQISQIYRIKTNGNQAKKIEY